MGNIIDKIKKRLKKSRLIFNFLNRSRFIFQKFKFRFPARPKKILMIPPANIINAIEDQHRHDFSHHRGLGQIYDKNFFEIFQAREYWIYKGLKDRYIKEKRWEDTHYIKHVRNWLNRSEQAWGNNSIQEFMEKRCGYVDSLFMSIKEKGYQLAQNNKEIDTNRHQYYYPTEVEITVLITAEGEIILHDGFHRFAIAEILGLEKIPIMVIARHIKWQQKRDFLYQYGVQKFRKKFTDELLKHPDLEDVLSVIKNTNLN